jgi:biopolymer transport protein ExbD
MSVLRQLAESECELEMTPMIDVTFLLLIFFVCTLRFKTLEGKLQAYLPKDVGVNMSKAEPKERVEIMITVVSEGKKVDPNYPDRDWSGKGRYEFVGRKLQYTVGARKTSDLGELKSNLERLYAADPTRPATLDCRPGTVYGDMVTALDVAVAVGYTDITFVGEYKQPAGQAGSSRP